MVVAPFKLFASLRLFTRSSCINPAISLFLRRPTLPFQSLPRRQLNIAMLKRALDSHKPTKPAQPPLAQQVFLSSSPTPVQESIKPYQRNTSSNGRPLSLSSGNIVRQGNLPSFGSSTSAQKPQGGLSSGIKRTSSGLEKVLATSNAFDNSKNQIVSGPEQSKTPSNPVVANKTATTFGVYFDEDDFDSDIDLDIEDPSTKNTINCPLPTAISPVFKPLFQPTRPVAASHAPGNWHPPQDSGYNSLEGATLEYSPISTHNQQIPSSSQPLSWASSPIEHYGPPSKSAPPPSKSSKIRQFTYTGQDSAPTQERSRAAKRSALPWQNGKKSEVQATSSPQPISGLQESISHPTIQTPLTKGSSKDPLPWNTTASVLKKQQKDLRQTSKKNVKTIEATEESKRESIEKIKKSKVSRIFLSAEQQHVLNLVVEHKKSVFFTGSAGTGKSVLLREIIAGLRKKFSREPDRVAVTASTGLAACNIGGVTLHSFAGIGLGKEAPEELVKKIKRNQKAKQRWLRTKVLIVDEISMVDGDLFDKLENIARILRNNGRPFGGIQLVITGDFFQLPPVPENGRLSKFAFDAGTWNTSIEHTIALHHVFRQKDPVFANMLNEMREGRLTPDSITSFRTLDRPLEYSDGMEATELFPTRQEVDRANNLRMHQLAGEVRVFEARDGGSITDKTFRDKLLQNCMAPERIALKVGAQVMLIKNIDETLVNGSLGKIIGFMSEQTYATMKDNEDVFEADDEDLTPADKRLKSRLTNINAADTSQLLPWVEFAVADGSSRRLLCTREAWKTELPNGEVQASRSQVPLILAWALSIHKAQGQTLERVKVDLGKVFEKGQAYVALSRATSMPGLQVKNFDPRKVVAHEKVRSFYAGLSRAEQIEAESKLEKGKDGSSKGAKRQKKLFPDIFNH